LADIKFQLPAFERLADILGDAYTDTEIAGLFKKAGFDAVERDVGTKRGFLYAAFEGLQREHGAAAILGVLKAACGPQVGPCGGDVRRGINECLSFYGLRIGEDGEEQKAGGAAAPPGADREMFLQRDYHSLVMEHARASFLQGDCFGAVSGCCRELEELVRKKSGLEMSGRGPMCRAPDPGGGLEAGLPRAASMARNGVQEGTHTSQK